MGDVIDLAEVLGVKREKFAWLGTEYEVRHPGELSFERRAAVTRWSRQIQEEEASLGLVIFAGIDPETGDPRPLPAMPESDEAAVDKSKNVDRLMNQIADVIIVGGSVATLPYAVKEVMMMRFFHQVPTMMLGGQQAGLGKWKASGELPSESPQPAVEPQSTG